MPKAVLTAEQIRDDLQTRMAKSPLACRELCACTYSYQSGIRRTHPAATGT
jgi:hypothetical protein